MFDWKRQERLERMLDEAIAGTFQESDYDESRLSRVEAKWKHFLGASVLSKENLEKEKENIKTLVSDISHQTRTPMANIKLYSALLKESLEQGVENNPDQNEKLLDELIRQTEKLEFLIESLTRLSRLESNTVEVKPEMQKIKGFLEETVRDAGIKAEKKGIEIQNTYTGEGSAYFDRKWTKEAIGNVLDNAVKYSPSDSRVILSAVDYEMYAAISVKDFGIGIREEELAKIFGRFYRSEDVQQEEGVGLGLYLAREILKKENGYMKVKSKYGEGTEFVLYLPKNRL